MAYYQGIHAAVQAKSSPTNRAQILEQLGLDPDTPQRGLQTIIRCASSAPALRPMRLEAFIRAQDNGAQ